MFIEADDSCYVFRLFVVYLLFYFVTKQCNVDNERRSVVFNYSVNLFYKFPESLKSHQKEIIECILAGKNDMIVVLPTGYGKSLLYTLPRAATATRWSTYVCLPVCVFRTGK